MPGDSTADHYSHFESHFAFGENWADYARTIDEQRLALAEQALIRLLGDEKIRGRSLLDIGCGSGLHAAAAARLGASHVLAVDIDPVAVEAARAVLEHFAGAGRYEVKVSSLFDLSPDRTFDIVYAWGALHHTGDMWHAIDRAVGLVRHGGTLAIALYAKTPMCGFWRLEKRLYASSPKALQRVIRAIYKVAFFAALVVTGRNPVTYVRTYQTRNRGMNWHHDVHDWLGGYPYESTTPEEVKSFLESRGFALERSFTIKPRFGLFGTGCNEYVFRKR